MSCQTKRFHFKYSFEHINLFNCTLLFATALLCFNKGWGRKEGENMVFSNADEEMKKIKELKSAIDEINSIEIDKLFISKEQLAEALGCSNRAAGEFMNSPGFPLLKIGGKPMVNVFALNEYTQQRIVLSEK